MADPAAHKRILLAGATGTIGRAVACELVARGYKVVCLVRDGADRSGLPDAAVLVPFAPENPAVEGPVDAVISCLAARSGAPDEAWAIDHRANSALLRAAQEAGAEHFVLLSAICVQKPELAFQHAKLAFERELIAASLAWTIIRPTAFFKSLSGQVARVMAGKPFVVFGDGTLTACKPISDRDLAGFIVNALEDPAMRGRILPVGGPGPAITPRDQAGHLFSLLNRPERVRRMPLWVMDTIIAALSLAAMVAPALRAKAEFARIGRYYARESMLVLDQATGLYDEDATPSYGKDTLFDYYAALVSGKARAERGAHAVFSDPAEP